MSRLTAYFLLLFSMSILASCVTVPQPEVPEEERSLQKVHEIDLKKSVIFDKSLEWMAQTFVDSKAVIELKDKESGKIIGKGRTSFNVESGLSSVPIPCRFTLMLEAKDNKYRATYDNFIGMWGQSENIPQPLKQKAHVDAVKEKMLQLDKALYDYLTKAKSNSNW